MRRHNSRVVLLALGIAAIGTGMSEALAWMIARAGRNPGPTVPCGRDIRL